MKKTSKAVPVEVSEGVIEANEVAAGAPEVAPQVSEADAEAPQAPTPQAPKNRKAAEAMIFALAEEKAKLAQDLDQIVQREDELIRLMNRLPE